MEIKRVKKVKRLKQQDVRADDLTRRPSIKNTPVQTQDEAFSYTKQGLKYDGKDVGEWISKTAKTQPELLSQIAGMLEKFKKDCLKRKPKKKLFGLFSRDENYSEEELSNIFALCDAYIARISELIKKRYEETKDGMSVAFDEDGQLILNGMNINAYVDNCRDNMNPKSLMFLKGIRTRLELVLENKSDNRNYERIQDVISALFNEIDQILKQQS